MAGPFLGIIDPFIKHIASPASRARLSRRPRSRLISWIHTALEL